MQNDSHVKTELAHKRLIALIVLPVILLSLFFLPKIQAVECLNYRMPVDSTLKINGKEFKSQVVKTEESRMLGLSGRPCIKKDAAMLFEFEASDISNHCFWMKDMRFPIDIIWLDTNKRVVHVENSLSPDTYPDNFCPEQPTRYVLELKAGTAARLNIRTSDSVKF